MFPSPANGYQRAANAIMETLLEGGRSKSYDRTEGVKGLMMCATAMIVADIKPDEAGAVFSRVYARLTKTCDECYAEYVKPIAESGNLAESTDATGKGCPDTRWDET